MDGANPRQYFDPKPQSASRPKPIQLTLPDRTIGLTTDSGVFSGGAVDAGTKYLLLDAPEPPAEATNLLDLGCGYGPIAITLALRAPQTTVWAVDVNERAVKLCESNAIAAGATGVRAFVAASPSHASAAGMPSEVQFDAIYSNPPIRIGKPALRNLLTGWLSRLTPDGHAYLVVQKHLGSDSLAQWLIESGWPTCRIGSRSGFRLLDVTTAQDTVAPANDGTP